MTSKEAMEILCDGEKIGEIDGTKILVTFIDIRENLRCNDFELDLGYIQDLTSYQNGNYEMYQGHSLEEVIF